MTKTIRENETEWLINNKTVLIRSSEDKTMVTIKQIGVEKNTIGNDEYYQCFYISHSTDFKKSIGDLFSNWRDINTEKEKLLNQINK